MRKVERFKNTIAIDEVVVYREAMNSKDIEENNWEEIEPKYYIDKSDDMIYEIWYNRTGIILDRGLNTYIKNDKIATDWTIANLKEINKESAMTKYKERLLAELPEPSSDEWTKTKSDSMDAMKYNIENNKLYIGVDLSNNKQKYKFGDILRVISGHDREVGTLFKVKDCTTRYRSEDVELYTGLLTTNEEINIHNQSILKSRMEFEKAKNTFIFRQGIESKGCNAEPIKQQNNGGSSDWYLLPDNAKTLQDLIEHRNMNGAVKDMFKACYRLGIKTEDELRDLNKTAYYALREIGRVTGRKDYITIAKELIGSQAIEKE